MATEEIELKDVTAVNRIFAGANTWWVEYAGRLPGGTFYSAEEWDLTVSLKRKPKPFKVGDRVSSRYSQRVLVIDAISDAYGQGDNRECWVRCPDGSHTTYQTGDLKHAPSEDESPV